MNALRVIVSFSLLAISSSKGAAQSPELPISAGLVVHIGSSDGVWECAWAKSGTILVHGLTLDAESLARSRSAIQKQGLYGLASVDKVTTFKKLPYADRLVHVVVADLDALGDQGPALSEIRRVLTPHGVALLKQKGEWQRHVEPMPKGMDEWNHWDRAADGNSLSRDPFIKPTTGIRWFTSPSSAEPGNFAGMLSNESRIYYHAKNPGKEETDSDAYAPKGTGNFFSRDAYNGLLLWKNPMERYPLRHAMAAIGGKLYFAHPQTGKLAVLDGKTGKHLHDLADAMPIATAMPKSFLKQNQDDRTLIRVEDGTLFQAYQQELRALALDQKGKLLWKFDGAKGLVRWFVVAEGKVFALVAQREASLRGEPYCHVVDTIVALDAKTGQKLWSNGAYAGLGIVRMIYDDHGVVLPLIPDLKTLDAGQYGHEYRVVRLDAATGKPTWDTAKNQPETGKISLKGSGHYQVPIVAHGKVYIGNQTGFALDAKTGLLTKKFNWGQFDNHCAELRACLDYTFYGTTFMDTDGKRITRGHARSRCDTGVFPAYGLLYVSPMTCICSDYLNGYFAIVGEKEWDPVPNEQRLVKGPAEVPAKAPPAESDWAMFRGNPKRSSATIAQGPLSPKLVWKTKVADWPAGHLVEDWKALETTVGVISAPTAAAGKIFVAVPDQHQVRAFDAKTGQSAWTFTTGARVNSPPTIHEGLCLFGGQDGWVYCLTANKGELVWKFLAARSEKKIAVQSQLESVWPVPGSVMVHKGQVVAVAGRQSGMDQGMTLYHLDVRTGKAQSSARIWHDPDAPTAGPKGNAGYQPIDRRVNDLLVSDGVKPHLLTVPLEEGYATNELVDTANFFKARGHTNRGTGIKTPPQLLWASSNGFITRRNESVGRFDDGLMCYANTLRAARIAFDDRLILQWGIRGKEKGAGYEMKQGAVDLKTAEKLDADVWKSLEGTTFQTRAVGSARSLVLSANAIYYGGSKQIVIVDRATGKESARLDLPAPLIRDGLAVTGGRLIAACEDGSIACFE